MQKIVPFLGYSAMSAGPLDPFNHAVSFLVNCESQAELDRYWSALLEGGSAEQCGWLKVRRVVANHPDGIERDDDVERSSESQARIGCNAEDGQDRHRRIAVGFLRSDANLSCRT